MCSLAEMEPFLSFVTEREESSATVCKVVKCAVLLEAH